MPEIHDASPANPPQPAVRPAPLLWPVICGLLVTVACLHPLWSNRIALDFGQFSSTVLYQSFIAVSLALLLLSVWRGQPRSILWWPLSVSLLSFSVVVGLKTLTRFSRPNGERTGFPSGHTTASFALAWLLTQTYPRLAPLWYAVAMSVAWSRVEVHAHYPYQVACGAIFGTLIGWWISHLAERVFRKKTFVKAKKE